MKRPLFHFIYENDETGEDEDLFIPGVNVICHRCHGAGVVDAPGISDNGLTSDDFAEDPEFAEDYAAGVYSVPCPECNGEKVFVEPDESARDLKGYAVAWATYDRYVEYQREAAREGANDRYTRRMESGGY